MVGENSTRQVTIFIMEYIMVLISDGSSDKGVHVCSENRDIDLFKACV